MTAPNPPIDNTIFILIEAEIRSLFNLLLIKVCARRDELLVDLHERWDVFVNEIKTRNNTLKDLAKMRDHFDQVSIKENFAVQIQEASLQEIEQQIQTLKDKVFEAPRLRFSECISEELMENIGQMGVIVEETSPTLDPSPDPIDYTKKTKAVRSIGSRGSEPGQFICPNRILIQSDRLFVADPGNKRIQILSLEGEPITQFGEDDLKFPVSIAASHSYYYVSDHTQECIARYDRTSLKLLNKQEETSGGAVGFLKSPRGIIVNGNDEVLVADHCDRVCVFDCELRFKRDFGVGVLHIPQFIQLRDGHIFVLDRSDPCLHKFSEEGNEICSMITRGFERQVRDGVSFCFDGSGNIIIADCGAERVRVFSCTGDVVHTLSMRTDTECGVCWGVATAGTQLFVTQGKGTVDIF